MDRYTKGVLTVIATALVYLCVILTPWPGVSAQTTQRPGEFTGPGQTVIVGFKLPPGESMPVSAVQTMPVMIKDTVHVTGTVVAQQDPAQPDRVTIAGWETEGSIRKPGEFRRFDRLNGLPVKQIQ